MENELRERRFKWQINPAQALFLGISFFMLGLGFLFSLRVLPTRVISKQLSANLPSYGWTVSEDLGVGQVPGGPTAQRFVLEQVNGWEVLAYCLDPQEPPPPVGTSCELMNENTFWCGDEFQNLREYQILQTPPPPVNTPTYTRTPTRTATSTPSHTPTAIPTTIPTATNTEIPKPAPTPTPRPKMGGDGNLQLGDGVRLAVGIGLIGIGSILAAINRKRTITNFKED